MSPQWHAQTWLQSTHNCTHAATGLARHLHVSQDDLHTPGTVKWWDTKNTGVWGCACVSVFGVGRWGGGEGGGCMICASRLLLCSLWCSISLFSYPLCHIHMKLPQRGRRLKHDYYCLLSVCPSNWHNFVWFFRTSHQALLSDLRGKGCSKGSVWCLVHVNVKINQKKPPKQTSTIFHFLSSAQ